MRFLVVLAPLVVLAACATVKVNPATTTQLQLAQQQWPSTNAEELEAGRELYRTRCNKCHGLRAPEALSPEEWHHELDEMAPKAKLTAEQREQVYRYLWAAGRPEPKTDEGVQAQQ